MRKQKKIIIQIMIFLLMLLSCRQVFATNIEDGDIDFSQNYLEYIGLSAEEKEKIIVPTMYDISKTTTEVTNPIKIVRMLGSSVNGFFSLRDIIPENMVVKNQMSSNICWAFSSLASLESHLALNDYKNKIANPIVYDFSERHMDYSTCRLFLDGKINEWGFNRKPGSNGVIGVSTAYLTNGLGAIAENDMEFKPDSNLIDISEIQGKEVITQINDIVTFPSYSETDDKIQIIQQMKEHIMNHGAIYASIHSSKLRTDSEVYNSKYAAAYCNSSGYKADHSVAIVGWDDTFKKEYFVEGNQPKQNGAWIIRNSWGIESGDEGYIYISYEDVNIYKQLIGIENAQSEITYENIYQYDEFGGFLKYRLKGTSKMYLATEFDKKTTGKEYLTQVAVTSPETYTCKVYVNPDGTGKTIDSGLQPVELKTGETETFDAGYHTIEFAEPIKIGDNFVVVLEIQGTQTDSISTLIELNYGEFYTSNPSAPNHAYDNVTISDSKCFLANEEQFNNNEWRDVTNSYETTSGRLPDFDTTIKAFTTTNILETISIETPPAVESYIEGQDFYSTGMVVNANYANGNSLEITNFTILNGEDLNAGQTSVTIVYKGKTVEQPIEVVKNIIESIAIKTPPTVTEYWAGEDFDATGMVVEAIYKDGTKEIITDFSIVDGTQLKNGQIEVTIQYEEKTAKQGIIVKLNSVVNLEVIVEDAKLSYVVGQSFFPEGIKINATYGNGIVKEVTDYTIKNGDNLQVGQTSVEIEYEGQTVTQSITVEEKQITGILIKNKPTKTEYIQNKEELDLTGGILTILYNDSTTEEIAMTSKEISIDGFNKEVCGVQNIIINYQGNTVQFDIEILELPKPENSNFESVEVNVKGLKAYYFTADNKKQYSIINVEISNVTKSIANDEMKYKYYLSSSPNEKNITDWIEISNMQEGGNSISFDINTLEISNNDELGNAETIYLYVKEVAIRNDFNSEKVTRALKLSVDNITIEEFIDGEKKADVNSDTITDSKPADELDNTLAPGIIPNAGKSLLVIFGACIIMIISRILYLKYNDIEIK